MNFKHTGKTAIRSIMDHKSRSLLTILGIVIGVSSVIIVMSLGGGAQALILNQISGLGAETVVIRPGEGFGDFTGSLLSDTLTQDDLDELKKKSNIPNLSEIAPFSIVNGGVEYGGKKYNPTVSGGPVEFIAGVFDVNPQEGHYYDETEIDQRKRVAVIGHDVKDELFENRSAIGEDIEIKGRKFEIVAVFNERADVGGFPFDEAVMIPQTAALDVMGTNHYTEIIIRADSVDNLDKVVADIERTMRDSHDLSYGEDNDFNIQTQENIMETVESVISVLTWFLVAVVTISLVVGGVGIMNIMLVSVTERTKEIGLRKALGARRSDILRQFLFEAVALTSLGGILGVIIGALVSFTASVVIVNFFAPNWTFEFPISAAIIGVGMSATVGLIFGTYPAVQASKKSPMEALRYE